MLVVSGFVVGATGVGSLTTELSGQAGGVSIVTELGGTGVADGGTTTTPRGDGVVVFFGVDEQAAKANVKAIKMNFMILSPCSIATLAATVDKAWIIDPETLVPAESHATAQL